MKEELDKLVAAGKIGRQHVDALLKLAQCGFCMHRSWGFGKITTIDTVFGRFTIDFINKPGHSMDLSFAADSLKPIDPEHIWARKMTDLSGLRQMAAVNHLELIQLVLQSYGGRATVEQIQQVLVPDVIVEDWRKWWEMAKRELKKNGHFQVPIKKADPVIFQAVELPLQERLMNDFRQAKGLKARLVMAHELLKNVADLQDAKGAFTETVAMLNVEIMSHQRTQAALALEAVFMRDEMRVAAGLPGVSEDITARQIWAQVHSPGPILEQIQVGKHRQALQSFKEATPNGWVEALQSALNSTSTKLSGECAQLLIQGGCLDQLKENLTRLVSQHMASSELLLWLAKERSDAFADILGPEVFRAMLSAIERDQFNEKKSNKLRDFILDDQELLLELIESADIEIVRDLTRTLQLSPSFDDMDKRSLLARIVKQFPAIQSMISGEQHTQRQQDSLLIVSWASLERRKNEYTDLVHKKIPTNSKEIAHARSYGDLRENHEYKAAKEMQKMLMRRKAELESELGRARGTDFATPRTDVVSVGTRVKLTNLAGQNTEEFGILGAWDFDLEKGIISYLSPMAHSLLNHAVGEEVEVDHEGQKQRFRIESISKYHKEENLKAASMDADVESSQGATSA